MKKSVVLSAVFCLMTITSINAQIRFGVKAGGNFSNLYVGGNKTGTSSDQYKGRFSYHFGGVMEYSLNRTFSIQPELLYLNHGSNMKDNNSFGMKDGHITLNTLQLPVNLKAAFDISNNRIFVYGGPYLSYHMYGKARGKLDGSKKASDIELFSRNDGMKRWDYGVGIGAGMEIDKFTIGIGNQIGIADIDEGSGRMRTGNVTVSLGYFF